MYSAAQLALKYLRYYLTASNGKGHGMHSPFVFEFITKVLDDKEQYPEYAKSENLRKQLLGNKTLIPIEDMGAGSAISVSDQRTVASVTKYAAKSKKFGQLLYRMVKHYQSKTIVELGTSLGITTSYLAEANPGARVITLEGASAISAIALRNFANLEIHNIELITGNFDNTLLPVVDGLPSIDLVFIDGNHRLQPTIQYFETLLPKTHNFSMIILDDIHWSDEMEQAWKYCREHPAVTVSIDLFFIGILVFRKEIREKQHFTIRF